MTAIHLRGLEPVLIHQLKERASTQDMSVNALILQILKQSLGFSTQRRLSVYHDLDCLAGTWSEEDGRLFNQTSADFEQIDEDLWQ